MVKRILILVFLICSANVKGQEINHRYKRSRVIVKDTIQIDTVSIMPSFFKLLDRDGNEIDASLYEVDFPKARIILKEPSQIVSDSIIVNYLRYPDFITRKYSAFNRSIIVGNTTTLNKLYAVEKREQSSVPGLLDGLVASGSISRGVTIGNNQNAVLTSQLDLQVSGNIASDVTLRASIRDANIPLQDNGYSQRLDEFDQVYIALNGNGWNMQAGDVNLTNSESYFMKFTKKIEGVSARATWGGSDGKTEVFGAGALVRGEFAQSRFQGQEGNQGPYKLIGPNQELFILIISGSERVYANGALLQRGENNDYVMDYNAGEITFTTNHPVTSDMRLSVEYQYTANSFTRFSTYAGITHQTHGLRIGAYWYAESDAKNQPLQENLSPGQVAILADAGDNRELMVAPSESPSSYAENKILYRKESIDGIEVFVYTTDPALTDELFTVRFSFVGANQGDYALVNTVATGRIFEYVPRVAGMQQGNYAPVIQLIAPDRLQLVALRGEFSPSEKTEIGFETSLSNHDKNLFSQQDDADNRGFASHFTLKQRVFSGGWQGDVFATHDFVASRFRNLEGLYQVEFSRDWNLSSTAGNQLENTAAIFGDQSLLRTGIMVTHAEKGQFQYRFERLAFKEYGAGNRHIVTGNTRLKNLQLQLFGSVLKNSTLADEATFSRFHLKSVYGFKKGWAGGIFQGEDNRQKAIATDLYTPLSQRFQSYQPFIGIGDSTKIFAEVGYTFRVNDSIRTNRLERFNTSQTYFLRSQLIASEKAQLSAWVSYRNFRYETPDMRYETALNSRLLYSQRFAKDIIHLTSVYENLSGTLPQQEFSYVEVEPGQGVYTWNDYNDNGIQELNEFEVAPFQDKAIYIRVLLPNQVFVKTHQNRFSQTLTADFGRWVNTGGLQKILRHFYHQTSYLIDRKIRREGANFNLNPFSTDREDNVLGLQQSVRATLFFNRARQRYTTSYTYLLNDSKNLLSIGAQGNRLNSHQLQFVHKMGDFWLLNLLGAVSDTESHSENFSSRNYEIQAHSITPRLSYLFSLNSRLEVFYEYEKKENLLGAEYLQQQRIGASFAHANAQKASVSGEFQIYNNRFTGDSFSPVGYQLLEGLQPGVNFTWAALAQKRLTKFLDLNLSYFGRKSGTSRAIHTGSIQLRAYF